MGEISDFQHIMTFLDELVTSDFCYDDGITLTPPEIFSYLCRVMYNRRTKMDPYWNSLLVAGFKDGEAFLGSVGSLGISYTDSHAACGFGNHLARPLFRERQRDDMEEEEAVKLVHDALRVCYYRDKNSINKFKLAKVTAAGVEISEPFALDTEWGFKAFEDPAKFAKGS